MTNFTRIAALTALAASFAGPAFAGDSDLQTLQQDSGRYISAITGTSALPNSYNPTKSEQVRNVSGISATDFQLSGR